MYIVMSMFMGVGMISSYVHDSTLVTCCIYVLSAWCGLCSWVVDVVGIWGSSPPGTAPVTHANNLFVCLLDCMCACLLASLSAIQPALPASMCVCLLLACYVLVFGVVYVHGVDVLGSWAAAHQEQPQ